MRISDWSSYVFPPDLYLPPAVPVDADRYQHRLASNHAAFAHFLVAGIKDQIRERLVEAALGKGRQAAIELLVDRRDRRGQKAWPHSSSVIALTLRVETPWTYI